MVTYIAFGKFYMNLWENHFEACIQQQDQTNLKTGMVVDIKLCGQHAKWYLPHTLLSIMHCMST